jgi:hypothetical protein
METHQKVYFTYFNILKNEDYFCEVCERPATGGIHHIDARGMGSRNTCKDGVTDVNDIRNLMALCNEHHVEYGDIEDLKPLLREIHTKRMNARTLYGVRPGERVAYTRIITQHSAPSV